MNAAIADEFVPDARQPDGVLDPVFGLVQRGSMHGLWAVNGPGIGLAQLTGGSRVVTPSGDGIALAVRRPAAAAGPRTVTSTWPASASPCIRRQPAAGAAAA